MPRQNRVTPLGELIAHPSRGHVFGNRGCLHDERGVVRRRWASRAWIACRLEFKDRRRELLQPGRYTELFFLDDATALAAGHRPCAECRREDFNRFVACWPGTFESRSRAPVIDGQLHAERLMRDGSRRLVADADWGSLPDGTFVLVSGEPWLVRGPRLQRWTPDGYADEVPRPGGADAVVLTPPSVVEVLRRGWEPTAVPLYA